MRLLCLIPVVLFSGLLAAQTTLESSIGSDAGAEAQSPASGVTTPFIRPVSGATIWVRPSQGTGVDWDGLNRDSSLFLGIQHGFRLLTEPGTRRGMKGPFFQGYLNSAGNIRGWSDGDPFYVNYIGHPLQGSASAFIWAQNDRNYTGVEFGRNRDYWMSRARATAYSFAYSAQFELGPLSEASIGKIQSRWPQQGLADIVITPTIGAGLMIAEDVLDRYLIQPFEMRVENPYLRLLMRAWLNPSRSWANAMRFKVPWARDDRPGVFKRELVSAYLRQQRGGGISRPANPRPEIEGEMGLSTVEVSMEFRPTFFTGSGGTGPCWGGGGEAALRLTPHWQLVGQAHGCNLTGLEKNLSGDTLSYLAGPRWSARPTSRWNPYAHVLVGGMRVAHERHDPGRKAAVDLIPKDQLDPTVKPHELYTTSYDANGWALAAGTGIDVRLNPAVAWRAASLEYKRAWVPAVNGLNYNGGLAFTTSFVLRMGTW